VKLIRNRLTDEFVDKLLPQLSHTMVLNLSQNFLTDRVFDSLMNGVSQMPNLRNVVLTQNRIRERSWKLKIDEFRKLNVNIVM
jgi:hypothetical protein